MVRFLKFVIAVAVVGVAAYFGWQLWHDQKKTEVIAGIASGTGRIEALDIDIATRTAGRLSDITTKEGAVVDAGAILAHIDLEPLNAQKREANARLVRAKIAVGTAETLVVQREAERDAAASVLSQREVEQQSAAKRLARTQQLSKSGSASDQLLDDDRARVEGTNSAAATAKAQLAASEAGIGGAKSQIVDAKAAMDAQQATIDRIDVDLRDSELKAPRSGRVQYLVAQPGEVLAAGGRVLNMLDLNEVTMTFFLPLSDASRVAIGSEARIILDAVPQYVIPANISFVSDVAQFTPKTVETEEERQKLMFRIRARIAPELVQKYIAQMKAGLSGRAYVKIDQKAEWPDALSQNLAK